MTEEILAKPSALNIVKNSFLDIFHNFRKFISPQVILLAALVFSSYINRYYHGSFTEFQAILGQYYFMGINLLFTCIFISYFTFSWQKFLFTESFKFYLQKDLKLFIKYFFIGIFIVVITIAPFFYFLKNVLFNLAFSIVVSSNYVESGDILRAGFTIARRASWAILFITIIGVLLLMFSVKLTSIIARERALGFIEAFKITRKSTWLFIKLLFLSIIIYFLISYLGKHLSHFIYGIFLNSVGATRFTVFVGTIFPAFTALLQIFFISSLITNIYKVFVPIKIADE